MSDHEHGNLHTTVRVTARYAAAKKPFVDEKTPRSQTLSALKAAILGAFGLTEGASVEGGTASYKLYKGRDELTDLSRTVGDTAGEAEALELKLSQVVTQGQPMFNGLRPLLS